MEFITLLSAFVLLPSYHLCRLMSCATLASFALPHLSTTSGYFLVIGSVGAQMRMPFASSYVLSKHAVNRLVEYIKTENPNVKAFSMNPGAIKTDMADNNPEAAPWLIDTLQLPAATALRMTSGKEDWLNGKSVSSSRRRWMSQCPVMTYQY